MNIFAYLVCMVNPDRLTCAGYKYVFSLFLKKHSSIL